MTGEAEAQRLIPPPGMAQRGLLDALVVKWQPEEALLRLRGYIREEAQQRRCAAAILRLRRGRGAGAGKGTQARGECSTRLVAIDAGARQESDGHDRR